MKKLNLIFSHLLIGIIKLYQKTLSFDHGFFSYLYPDGYCRYHPTCSEYAAQAIKKYGVWLGLLRGVWRIIRCNPFSRGGIDKP